MKEVEKKNQIYKNDWKWHRIWHRNRLLQETKVGNLLVRLNQTLTLAPCNVTISGFDAQMTGYRKETNKIKKECIALKSKYENKW